MEISTESGKEYFIQDGLAMRLYYIRRRPFLV